MKPQPRSAGDWLEPPKREESKPESEDRVLPVHPVQHQDPLPAEDMEAVGAT
jgi:hypothetical protein